MHNLALRDFKDAKQFWLNLNSSQRERMISGTLLPTGCVTEDLGMIGKRFCSSENTSHQREFEKLMNFILESKKGGD